MPEAPARPQQPGRWWAAARAHALAAATLHHLAVFPLARSKFPAIASAHPDDNPCTGQCGQVGHGVYDASTDPERVRELFAAAPWAAGYGIACGRTPHHLFGLDLDRKAGVDGVANFRALATRYGITMPRTALVVTQSGGLHAWLSAPPDVVVPNTASVLAQGVDTRGSGGYLVGPGSLGPRGRYAFAPGSGPQHIAPVPPRLLELLTPPHKPAQARSKGIRPGSSSGSPQRRLDALVRFVRGDASPGRNNRLYWAARQAFAADGIDPEQAAADLLAAGLAIGLDEPEAAHAIASARKGAARDRRKEVTR
ncbi:bifunctional DNA primase/polymerase [Streptacidiphilus monticola]|uniref:Bifunctional DNA primase/polymerase n=1 Tax=Streptacidiphilus monticola TaxID=2161674 RepID=A0ABW1G6Q8_9ACTN